METTQIGVTLPVELYDLLKAEADGKSVKLAPFVRQVLADHASYVMPIDFGAKAKVDPEVRKARKEAKKSLIDKLLLEYFERHPEERAALGI